MREPPTKGFTLMEMALGMMMLSIITVSVSSLIKTAAEGQLAERQNQQAQFITTAYINEMRLDMREAQSIDIRNNGQTLVVNPAYDSRRTINNNPIVYYCNSASKTIYRRVGISTSLYPQTNVVFNRTWGSGSSVLNVTCPKNFFQVGSYNTAGQMASLVIPRLTVWADGSRNSVIDRYFGRQPGSPTANLGGGGFYSLSNLVFNVPGAVEFR